jgi:hypothetical protein
MTAGDLLHQVVLRFENDRFHQDLSTASFANGYLWTASDEENAIVRLATIEDWTFGNSESFAFSTLLADFDDTVGEVDVEGLDCTADYLWLVGSHGTKRKKVKKGKVENLKIVDTDPNRYLLARIPLVGDQLVSTQAERRAAYLQKTPEGNVLMTALKQDDYLAPFLAESLPQVRPLPGKDNGFDIEGLATHENRALVGLRGPVLRGIAMMLELELDEPEPGRLTLKPDNEGNLYRRHFLDLDGLGVRELCLDGDDLLILAGPTMDLDGTLRLFRLSDVWTLPADSFSDRDTRLTALFDIPHGRGTDKAEGVALLSRSGQPKGVLVVYDSPKPERVIDGSHVIADVFALE